MGGASVYSCFSFSVLLFLLVWAVSVPRGHLRRELEVFSGPLEPFPGPARAQPRLPTCGLVCPSPSRLPPERGKRKTEVGKRGAGPSALLWPGLEGQGLCTRRRGSPLPSLVPPAAPDTRAAGQAGALVSGRGRLWGCPAQPLPQILFHSQLQRIFLL